MDYTALGDLKVKREFAKYGAKAVFGKDETLLYIHVCDWNRDVYPPKKVENTEQRNKEREEWNYAKWVSIVFPLISGGKVALNRLRPLLRFNATFPDPPDIKGKTL